MLVGVVLRWAHRNVLVVCGASFDAEELVVTCFCNGGVWSGRGAPACGLRGAHGRALLLFAAGK
jgi:L-aminopeptidase/D-esterase-like protein